MISVYNTAESRDN